MDTLIICLPNVALSKGSGKQRVNYRLREALKNALTSSLLQLLQGYHSLKKHIKPIELSRHGRYVWPEGKCHLALRFRMSVKQLESFVSKCCNRKNYDAFQKEVEE